MEKVTNKEIALFIGGQIIESEIVEMPHGSYSEVEIQKWKVPSGIDYNQSTSIGIFSFDRDWNQLITVIEFIEKKGYTVQIQHNSCKIIENYKIYPIIESFGKTKIEAVYDSICKFIPYEKDNEI
jgi:hypothetical protein